jgi:hypothetical protein
MEHPFANPIGNSSNNTSKVWIAWSLITCIKIMETKSQNIKQTLQIFSSIQEDSIFFG